MSRESQKLLSRLFLTVVPPRQLVRVVHSAHGVCPSRANRERLRAQFKLRRLGRALPASPRSRPLSLFCSSRPGRAWRTRGPSRCACVCGRSSPGKPPGWLQGKAPSAPLCAAVPLHGGIRSEGLARGGERGSR